MADYYPLIARAVAGLERNTGETRRALYDRARSALVGQLRSVTPALSESDVTRERLALEEAVRKVEAESVRQARLDPRPESRSKVKAPEMPRWEAPRAPPAAAPSEQPPEPPQPSPRRSASPPPRSENLQRPAPRPRYAPEPAKAKPDDQAAVALDVQPSEPPSPGSAPVARTAARPQRAPLREWPPGERQSLLESVNEFRNAVSETEERAEAPIRPQRWGRREHPEAPLSARDLDRLALRGPSDELLADGAALEMLEPTQGMEEASAVPGPPQFARDEARKRRESLGARSYQSFISLALGLLVVAAVGGVLGWQWSNLTAFYRAWTAPPTMEVAGTETPAPVSRTKIVDRYEPGTAAAASQEKAALTPDNALGPAVAQRVVLYEETPGNPQGKRFVGSAIWRTEKVSPGPGQPPELTIRADVEIPERQISMRWSLRRNTDPTLPASHTIEIVFKLPNDFDGGGVSNVPGIMMKQAEEERGASLAGLAVKVTDGYFLIGLSAVDADKERNIALLKERPWFDIPVLYNNNRRAILALEKGTPGESAFAEAFTAWRQ
jgi:hypothetical protein